MANYAVYIIKNFESRLNALMGVVRSAERFLGPDDDWVEDDRRILFEAAERHLGPLTGYVFIYTIGDRDYIGNVDLSPDEFEEFLHEHDYHRNLVSGRKRRETDGGLQYAYSSWAKYIDDEGGEENQHQHHVWFFEAEDGSTDVYAHFEDNVIDSAAHLHVRDDDDDIKGMERAEPLNLFEVLDENGIDYTTP